MKKKVWLVTGASSGLGQSIAQRALIEGHDVIGTFREQEQALAFEKIHGPNAKGVVLDLTNSASIVSAFKDIQQLFPTINVLVNNAGYGIACAIEEASIEETKKLFEANFFGTLQLTQLVLPIMRKSRMGHIIQISSHGGIKAFPGFGIYNASKFALEGMSESLAQEVAPLGIHVTIVEPGPFRTNFAGSSFQHSKNTIEDYKDTAGIFRERMSQVNGKQEGDPIKAASAIFDITEIEKPPLRLPLGKIAVASITSKIKSVQEDLDNWRHVAESVVY
jgi:NAD(P)-dependent dehydrogenase (short-subunit alcohol dehydrogenase family)